MIIVTHSLEFACIRKNKKRNEWYEHSDHPENISWIKYNWMENEHI